MARYIPLTKGKFAIVDDFDFEWLNQSRWTVLTQHRQCRTTFYAVRYEKMGDKRIRMHREIAAYAGILLDVRSDVDHTDGDGLNNLRENLRQATPSQNGQNRHKQPGCSSVFKGVIWSGTKWRVQIRVAGRLKDMGRFDDEFLAAAAYNRAALRFFGPFARINPL